jgi:hypothetical protein
LFCQGRFNGYRELTEGEHVTFDIGQGQKGPQAQNIVAAERATKRWTRRLTGSAAASLVQRRKT